MAKRESPRKLNQTEAMRERHRVPGKPSSTRRHKHITFVHMDGCKRKQSRCKAISINAASQQSDLEWTHGRKNMLQSTTILRGRNQQKVTLCVYVDGHEGVSMITEA